MSLNTILATATTGLQASQTALRAVSDNVTNVNTPGYVRKIVNQQPLVVGAAGMGVEVTGIQRVTDQYLEQASINAGAASSQAATYAQYMDTAQGLFGDPTSDTFFFNKLDTIFSGFGAAANDPSNTLLRTQAVSNVQDLLNNAQRISSQLTNLGQTMDTRASADVASVNDLLKQINSLNADIARAKVTQQDSSGAENIQSQLVDKLSALMGVRVSPRVGGGVDIRSSDGVMLAGDGAATLAYETNGFLPSYVAVLPADGIGAPQPIKVDGGEIRGLLDLRNTKLPQLNDQLGEFIQRTSQQLNAAHNDSTSVPPPASLTGRNTGMMDEASALANFSGQATVAIVDSSGVMQQRVDIDFTAGTMSVNGGPATGFTPSTFDTDLTTALGGAGTATFSNGVLSIAANGGNGVSINEGTSQKAGMGFSAYFGLNDLIRPSGLGTYDTGLTGADANGFNPGDTITFRLSQTDGTPIRDVTVTVPAAPTMDDLVDALNNAGTGVGVYGLFSLSANGELTYTPAQPANAQLSVVQDNTSRGPGGPSMSELFGLGMGVRATRTNQFQVDANIVNNTTRLAFSQLDLNATVGGGPAISAGDATGALALANSGSVNLQFGPAGALASVNTSASGYAAEFAGQVARDAADADTQKASADAIQKEADARRQATEGVSLDEELVNLTTYQSAFNAAARLISATKDMFDVLTNMI
jgi:flagellar hook-associated protein 1 FlgK